MQIYLHTYKLNIMFLCKRLDVFVTVNPEGPLIVGKQSRISLADVAQIFGKNMLIF